MKTILSTILAAAALSTTAGAWERPYYPSRHCEPAPHCRPVYKTHTCEVDRCCHTKVGYDHCGRSYYYTVTVVTYRNFYSDGSSSTFTRTFHS